MYNQQPVAKGCFTIILVIIFGIPIFSTALIFIIYLFSKNILLGIIFCVVLLLLAEVWRKKQKQTTKAILDTPQDKNNDLIASRLETFEIERKKRNKILKDFRNRLKVNKKPDDYLEYRNCKIKVYNLPRGNKIFQIVDWDNRTRSTKYFSLEDAERGIQYMYASYPNKEAYLAEKERVLRKKEQDYFLAKSYRQRQKKAKFQKNLKTIDDLLKLTPIQFEQWVKNNIFIKDGWSVEETKITGDGGIDLTLQKNGEHSIAQCKRFKSSVGEPLLRDFYGAMMSEGVSRGYFVTTGTFTLQAQKFADNKPIVLIDRRVLAQRLTVGVGYLSGYYLH